MSWPRENIPDENSLFYRIHRTWIQNGNPIPGAFKDREGAMSADWEKYSTPKETKNRARTPDDNGVVEMNVKDIRNIPNQTVEHSPIPDINRSHTNIIGEKDEEVRLKFRRISNWVITI